MVHNWIQLACTAPPLTSARGRQPSLSLEKSTDVALAEADAAQSVSVRVMDNFRIHWVYNRPA